MPEELKFTVLENGLDFIFTALDHLRGDPKPRGLKYAVLHLSAGVELILKDRLRREHWSLVFDNIDKADLETYSSGDFTSVSLKTSIQRLIKICDIDIDSDKQRSLFNLRKSRNRLEHFATVDSPTALKASSAGVLSFTLDFIVNEFVADELEESETELLGGIRKLLPEFEQFVESRMKEINDILTADNTPIVDCPRCTQPAMKIDDGVTCHFCGYSADGDVGAQDYTESLFGLDWKHVADGGLIPIYNCPECGSEALVDVGSLKQDFSSERFVCFSCGNSWDWGTMDFCERCGTPTPHNEDEGLAICESCWQRA
jgi:hypothetical protein